MRKAHYVTVGKGDIYKVGFYFDELQGICAHILSTNLIPSMK